MGLFKNLKVESEILFKNFLEEWDAIFCGREAREKIWQTEFPHEP